MALALSKACPEPFDKLRTGFAEGSKGEHRATIGIAGAFKRGTIKRY